MQQETALSILIWSLLGALIGSAVSTALTMYVGERSRRSHIWMREWQMNQQRDAAVKLLTAIHELTQVLVSLLSLRPLSEDWKVNRKLLSHKHSELIHASVLLELYGSPDMIAVADYEFRQKLADALKRNQYQELVTLLTEAQTKFIAAVRKEFGL